MPVEERSDAKACRSGYFKAANCEQIGRVRRVVRSG
jgi:hypothetical protein